MPGQRKSWLLLQLRCVSQQCWFVALVAAWICGHDDCDVFLELFAIPIDSIFVLIPMDRGVSLLAWTGLLEAKRLEDRRKLSGQERQYQFQSLFIQFLGFVDIFGTWLYISPISMFRKLYFWLGFPTKHLIGWRGEDVWFGVGTFGTMDDSMQGLGNCYRLSSLQYIIITVIIVIVIIIIIIVIIIIIIMTDPLKSRMVVKTTNCKDRMAGRWFL